MSSETLTLQFTPTSSFVQPSFWNKFCDLKINVDKLNESARKIWGFYSNTSAWTTHVLEVDSTSFNTNLLEDRGIPFHGKIFNKNTIEQFKECDKNQLINSEGKELLDNIMSGKVLENPSLLNTFFILSFGDLKKYHFYYWFAFPVPHNLKLALEKKIPISEEMSAPEQMHLLESYKKLNIHQKPYFLIHNTEIYPFSEKLQEIDESNYQNFYFALSDYTLGENCPKPQLKNYVLFLLHHCPFLGGNTIKFLSFSIDRKLTTLQGSLYKITLPTTDVESLTYEGNLWAGWEKNEKNKFAPRFSNMRSIMDPAILYEESVDLNLRLMKWRLLPDVDLEKIKHLNCLLLGAGTLGCSVARTLLGWGVRNITFVDNSSVSYSNPVRQSLYTYEDSMRGRLKAEAAADSLRKILPSVNSQAYNLTIPMPGHAVDASSMTSVAETVEELKKLVQENDVVFLLTDSRESRWLPTLISKFYGKIIINVALGFDTYLIMRYGGGSDGKKDITVPEGFKAISGGDLGCYFCNDVTAPGNSLKDRTLDQQCTVTRPGISSIAGAMAVELLISITQHKNGVDAPAFYKIHSASASEPEDILNSDVEDNQSILGVLPHSIRGFLTNFTHIFPATPRYDQCIACSNKVLEEFREKSFEFLCNAFNIPKYLEDLTGLSTLLDDANFDDVIEINDEDDWGT